MRVVQPSGPVGLRITVLAAAVSAVLGGASSVQAQDSVEEVLVTGSRIVRRDFEANSPIITLDSTRFEESSAVGIESVVNQLPSFVPSVGSFSTGVGPNGGFNDQIATGSTRTPSQATLSLRGLGPNRNLVLLDGRRAMPINASMAVSINTIPSAAISRIETITGGASSVYGADAVAGVVNFITKRDFEGFDFDAQYGQTQEGDGEEFRFSGVMGANFSDGRGNVLLGFERSEREEVLRADRDYVLDGFANPRSLTSGAFWGAMGYSPVAANMHTRAAVDAVFGAGRITNLNRQFYMNDDGSLYTETADGAYRYTGGFTKPRVGRTVAEGRRERRPQQGTLRENLIDANLQSPLSRYSLFGKAHMDLSDNIEASLTMMYSESSTKTSADNSPMLGGWRASAPHGAGIYAPSVGPGGATSERLPARRRVRIELPRHRRLHEVTGVPDAARAHAAARLASESGSRLGVPAAREMGRLAPQRRVGVVAPDRRRDRAARSRSRTGRGSSPARRDSPAPRRSTAAWSRSSVTGCCSASRTTAAARASRATRSARASRPTRSRARAASAALRASAATRSSSFRRRTAKRR